jgi:hypothetical protein
MHSDKLWREEAWIRRFFIEAKEPGYVYIIENAGKFKIGSSKPGRNRLRAAQTWLPDMMILGVKPFWDYKEKERLLHVGCADCWYDGEWFLPLDNDYREFLFSEFNAFSDDDINKNSVDSICFYNGSGMAEFAMEQHSQDIPLRQFQRQNAVMSKGLQLSQKP